MFFLRPEAKKRPPCGCKEAIHSAIIAEHNIFPFFVSQDELKENCAYSIRNCLGSQEVPLRRRVLGDETLESGAPINFAGARLEELRDKEDLPGDFVGR